MATSDNNITPKTYNYKKDNIDTTYTPKEELVTVCRYNPYTEKTSCSPQNKITSFTITRTYDLKLNKTCINVYNGNVRQTNTDTCNENEIDGGNKIYTDINLKEDGKYPFTINTNKETGFLNTIKIGEGDDIFTCNANIEVSTDNKYIIRPISLSQPFNRTPSSEPGSYNATNWQKYYNSNDDVVYITDRTAQSTTEEPMYSVTLDSSVYDIIAKGKDLSKSIWNFDEDEYDKDTGTYQNKFLDELDKEGKIEINATRDAHTGEKK